MTFWIILHVKMLTLKNLCSRLSLQYFFSFRHVILMRVPYPKPQIYCFWPGESTHHCINNDDIFLRNLHEKMSDPKSIQDQSGMVQGPPGHQKTSFEII